MIKFITKEEPTPLKFEDVEKDQFFINSRGSLCMKANDASYVIIARSSGEPFCKRVPGVPCYDLVRRILPKVQKIEF